MIYRAILAMSLAAILVGCASTRPAPVIAGSRTPIPPRPPTTTTPVTPTQPPV
ncbi:MAG: penicillin-binding protein activator LpoB, partial [Alphaproteobacteria bacterium]